jgi:6-phosphofructokinase 2
MKIITITLNPALDKSTSLDKIIPEMKLRCETPVFEPGGGGINISRAIKILGGESIAIYAGGGPAGERIEQLLSEEGIKQHRIKTKSFTRENLLVTEKASDKHYRFGMPGNVISEKEIQQVLDAINYYAAEADYLVASGSLPPGADDSLYAQIASIAMKRNIKCVIDTSGNALKKAVENGVCLIKPNLRELSQLAGKEELSGDDQEEIALDLIKNNRASMVVVSLGSRGAMMVTKDFIEYAVPPTVRQKSTVGAGDSMVAAMVLALSRGDHPKVALKWGVAAGTAATITPGTELCRKDDVNRIFNWINKRS